ncbi:hypothetical protein EI42_00130 [Thermosporothrix hazakensis]|jgi:hypothetical protein|uniref:Uncharacterized protein n=2 Tax=Thermosporothrix TaxID=768650 RepID=A0A326UTD0_THEHA|nr:hypothetical protein [Thermosporothrix hazakensis]PZW35963.1 hypothetical protein EI42_00130 [Thermosporothrix hazakensis]BBH88432.1 hypothetical protein KTC_31830 [Thermosporothrix sp. COM3]GCE46618.1 hypothetical protein KTH_14870 [Thermosporothrix hazakensis]
MNEQECKRIGRYHSCVENGQLKLYYHQVGDPNGFYGSMDPEETLGLLEFLSRHREAIYQAVNQKEMQQHYL